MGWAESTRPRERFARPADAAKPRFEPVLPQSRLAAASLIQSALVAAIAVSFIASTAPVRGQLVDGLALLALLSAAIVAYIVVRHDGTGKPSDTPGIGHAVHGRRDPSLPRPDFAGDADQLAQIKARVSHELRTPLNAVIGFSELMHREALGPVGNDRYREYAGHIRRSAEHFQWATERTLAATEILTSPRHRTRSAIQLRDVAVRAFDRAQTEWVGARGIVRTTKICDQLEVEGCRESLDHSLQYLMSAALAIASSRLGLRNVAISCEALECGRVAFTVKVPLSGGSNGSRLDGEQAPGAELSLMLARLGLETSGGRIETDIADGQWRATAWLTQARQREFPLV